jgi:hypothetical protein
MAEFDPDAFLKGTAPLAPAFDPDAFLKGGPAAPEAPSREKELRAQYGKEIAQRGEPGYGERFIDAATMGLARPLSGAVRAVGGVLDPTTTAGERYRAGVGAAEDYFKKGEENTAGVGGFATDVAGALAAPPVGKLALLGKGAAQGGRELLGRIIAQGATTGAVEGAARNAEDVGSAVKGAATGGVLGGATAGAVGAAAKAIPGVGAAQEAVRKANQGATPDELKAAAKPLFDKLDQNGIAYAQPQTATLKQGIDDLIANNKYNPHANPTLKGYVDQLSTIATQPQGAKFTELNNLRSALAEQARGPDPSTRRAAGEIIGKIDDLVLHNKPAINPAGIDVAGVHKEARELWKSAMLADDVGYAAGKAERKVLSKSGVNPDEANRGAFRPMLEKAEKPGAYSPYDAAQRDLLARIVQGDKLQNTYRNLGAAAESPITKGLVSAGAGALGFAHGDPTFGLASMGGARLGSEAGGLITKGLNRAAANRGAANIDELIRNITGSAPKPIPAEALRTLLAKQAAQRAGAAYTSSKLGEQ